MPHDDDGLDGMSDQQLNGLVSREIFGSTFADEDCEGWATDPRASAELRREMERRGFDWQLYNGGAQYIAKFGAGRRSVHVQSPTEERAITIAAIRAVRRGNV